MTSLSSYQLRVLLILLLTLSLSTILQVKSRPAHTTIPRADADTDQDESDSETETVQNTRVTLPPSSQLIEFQPCLSRATIPIVISANTFHSSQASSLYIVTHGASADPENYFSYIHRIVGSRGIIVAPGFYKTDDDIAPSTFYHPDRNLAWEAHSNAYNSGDDAISPTSGIFNAVNQGCSSFDVYDSLLSYFSNRASFPRLTKVYFVGHSGGSNTISRYSQFLQDERYPFSIRYILANTANQAYFTNARPETQVCSRAFQWPFQLSRNGMNRYTDARFTNANELFTRWIQKDIITLVGALDARSTFTKGTEGCSSRAQGGINRRDRNYAWWAYINILSGRADQVKAYYGYQQLIETGANQIAPSTLFHHQNCIVDNVGHNAPRMFRSQCGISALLGNTLPRGGQPK